MPVGLRPGLRGGAACFLKTKCLDQLKTKLRTVDFFPLVEFSENSKGGPLLDAAKIRCPAVWGGGTGRIVDHIHSLKSQVESAYYLHNSNPPVRVHTPLL